MEMIFYLIVIIFSIIIHEVAHGWAALKLGDDTALRLGRLTLNPIPHIDPFGSIILPFFLWFTAMMTGSTPILFGWAKPVPYNPFNLKNPRRDSALLALAGPAANLTLALIFGLIIRFAHFWPLLLKTLPFLTIIVIMNLVLGLFNLLPIPPLDGSKILFYFINDVKVEALFERYGFAFLIIFLVFGSRFLSLPIYYLFHLITGF